MRRYFFYLMVSFSTFGIGAACVSLVLLKSETENFRQTKTVEIFETKVEKPEPMQSFENQSEAFQCTDEAIAAVWDKLKQNESFVEDAYLIMKARRIYVCDKLFNKTAVVDLNNDKFEEVIVQGSYLMSCSSGGNCPTWIVSKVGHEYRIIFESEVGDLPQDLAFLQSRSRKFQDLKVKLPHGWAADNYAYFKFNGKKYQIVKCLEDVNSAYDYDGVRDKKLVSATLKDCL